MCSLFTWLVFIIHPCFHSKEQPNACKQEALFLLLRSFISVILPEKVSEVGKQIDCAWMFGTNLGLFCENPRDWRARCYLGVSVCDSASVLFCLTAGAWRTEEIFPLVRDDVERLFVSNCVFSKNPKILMWELLFFFFFKLSNLK